MVPHMMNARGSVGVKAIIAFVLLGVLAFAGLQVLPVVSLYLEHRNFRSAVEQKVRSVFDIFSLLDTEKLLTEEIIELLDKMGAQYLKNHVQVNVEERAKKVSVQVWYSRAHKSLFFPNPKHFYVRVDGTGTVRGLRAALPTSAVDVTDASFAQEVLASPSPVMVAFWAPWCGYCRQALPSIDEAARLFAGKVKIAKLDVDDNNESSSKYGIRGIPAFIIFKNGKIIGRQVGFSSQDELFAMIRQYV
jgi:thioredoxin 1